MDLKTALVRLPLEQREEVIRALSHQSMLDFLANVLERSQEVYIAGQMGLDESNIQHDRLRAMLNAEYRFALQFATDVQTLINPERNIT